MDGGRGALSWWARLLARAGCASVSFRGPAEEQVVR